MITDHYNVIIIGKNVGGSTLAYKLAEMDFLLVSVMKTSTSLMNDILAVAMIWGPILLAVAILALARRASKRNSLT